MCATIIEPHPALLTPFAILLLSIAIFPLILRQRWERHYQKLCALLPVGPPLFLGYIKGVPFLWTALHCWPQWLTATAALLGIFFVADTISRSRGPTAELPATRFHCYGKWNFGALLVLLLILIFVPDGVREPLMLMVAMVSYFFTPQRVFEANEFSWRPLIEVAWIFLGIFGTMIPVLDYVEFHVSDFHFASDARFYWSTGLLSGVLDNAPTYLTILTAALSLDHFDINRLPDVAEFASGHGSRLAAISVAATFFGGLTYIGNSPNLLIRAIAESRHVPTPGFLAYIIRYALPILIPILGLVGLIFFRG